MALFENVCGECGYRTGQQRQSEAERLVIEHYRTQHPGLWPGGGQWIIDAPEPPLKQGRGGGMGCGAWFGILIVAFFLLAMCSRG